MPRKPTKNREPLTADELKAIRAKFGFTDEEADQFTESGRSFRDLRGQRIEMHSTQTRSQSDRRGSATQKRTPMAKRTNTNPKVDIEASVQNALTADRKRRNEIKAIGEKFGFPEEARNFADSRKTTREFQEHILAKSPSELKASLETSSPSQADQEAEANAAVARIKERRRKARALA